MAEEDKISLSKTTSTSSEDLNKEEEEKIPERTEDVAVGAEDEEKKVAEENGNENEGNSEAESLQNMESKEPEELTEKDRLVLYEKGVRLKDLLFYLHPSKEMILKEMKHGLKWAKHYAQEERKQQACFAMFLELFTRAEGERSFSSPTRMFAQYCRNIQPRRRILYTDEAAIQFAQAEKLYYETALITVDNKAESGATDSNTDGISAETQGPPAANSTDAQKAEEYEKLAHMCLKQQNPQLALDYCAKAVKLQQSCYGEQHPVTLKTLDLFTVIYAEMGKQQYKAALDKFSAAQEKEKEAKASKETTKEKEKDSVSTEETAQEKPLCSKESDQTTDTKMEDAKNSDQEQTENTTEEATTSSQDTVKVTITSSQALMVYFIITILLAVILTTALCYITQTDPKTAYNYMITRIRFYYYYYFKRKGSHGHQYF